MNDELDPSAFNEGTEEEGTVILDPELKKQAEEEKEQRAKAAAKRKEINDAINNAIGGLKVHYNVDVVLAGHVVDADEFGIWKTERMPQISVSGLARLIDNNL